MNLYGSILRRQRQSRGILLKTLAHELGVDQSYLSAVERGRKGPPASPAFLESIRRLLDLSAEEYGELSAAAETTRRLGKFGRMARAPLTAELAVDFARRMNSLRPAQLRAIRAILEME